MSLSVIKPGLLDTLQDVGRSGFAQWGINPGGAMDGFAARVANTLVGNCNTEAVLEIHFPGPQLIFEQNALIAITGGDFTASLNEEPVKTWQPVVVRKNTVLHFPKLQWGARAYIAVHGGFCLKRWLNSYSTNLKAAAGGWFGRQLRKGDELPFKENTIYFAGWLTENHYKKELPWLADPQMAYHRPNDVLFIPGNEWDTLDGESRRLFLERPFNIHPSSDRMGYQLSGPALEMTRKFELISTGVSFGTVQLLPNGQLVLLMADHQTTGGYPRIGHVISAHLPKLAQLKQSDPVRFTQTDIRTAEELLYRQQRNLKILQRSCGDHLNEFLC